jgi:hypothetical protein
MALMLFMSFTVAFSQATHWQSLPLKLQGGIGMYSVDTADDIMYLSRDFRWVNGVKTNLIDMMV